LPYVLQAHFVSSEVLKLEMPRLVSILLVKPQVLPCVDKLGLVAVTGLSCNQYWAAVVDLVDKPEHGRVSVEFILSSSS